MTLYQLTEQLKAIALRQPNVRSAAEGSVYEIMNANPGVEYDAFVITQGVHSSDDNFNHFNLSLFLISRLESNLEANRLQVQSSAREVLDNILTYFAYNFDGDTGETIIFHTFTERFADECAGAWCEVTVDVPKNGICPEDYDGDDWVSPNLTVRNQRKSVEVTAATQTVTYDSGYTGLESVEINAGAYGDGKYNEGYSDGYEEGDAEGYNEGYAAATEEVLETVASGAVRATYDANGTYYADVDEQGNGYISAVTVNIPQGKLKVTDYPGLKFAYSTWTEVPDYLDFEGVTDMSHMFAGTSLSGSQTFDLSGVTSVEGMFLSAGSITALTLTGADDVESMRQFAYECAALESFEMYGACRPTDMESAFDSCVILKKVLLPDTSKVTNMNSMFRFCYQLSAVTLNTDSVTDITMAFIWCSAITEIHLTSLANIPAYSYMGGVFTQCNSLEVLTLTAWPDRNLSGIGLEYCSLLTHDSIVGLLNALPQASGSHSFQIGQTNIDKLTEEEIAIATDKGWTLV